MGTLSTDSCSRPRAYSQTRKARLRAIEAEMRRSIMSHRPLSGGPCGFACARAIIAQKRGQAPRQILARHGFESASNAQRYAAGFFADHEQDGVGILAQSQSGTVPHA